MEDPKYEAFKMGGIFFTKIISYIEQSLFSIRSSATESTGKIMDAAMEMSTISRKRKEEAEKMMQDMHLNPDKNMEKELEQHQKDVDDILESAMQGGDSKESSHDLERARSRREGGKFSKNVEAISMYEEKLTQILVSMSGSLSNEDVMKQLLENIVDGGKDLADFLGEISLQAKIDGKSVNDKMGSIIANSKKRCKSVREKKGLEEAFSNFKTSMAIDEKTSNMVNITNIIGFSLSYNLYIKSLLKVLKEGYSDIIDAATQSIYSINDSASQMKTHANSIMMQTKDGGFENQSMSDYEKEQGSLFPQIEKQNLDAQKEAKLELFSVPKDLLAGMDDQVGNQMMDVMGSLSVGDVISQRINNIYRTCEALQKIFHFLYDDLENRLDTKTLSKVQKDCEDYIRSTFVTEEERILFNTLFEEKLSA